MINKTLVTMIYRVLVLTAVTGVVFAFVGTVLIFTTGGALS
jgi:hypothetical protein